MGIVKGFEILVHHRQLFLHRGFAGVGSTLSTGSGKSVSAEEVVKCFIPLNLPQWESMLADHPDRNYVEFILNGIRDGFQIGFSQAMGGELPLASI